MTELNQAYYGALKFHFHGLLIDYEMHPQSFVGTHTRRSLYQIAKKRALVYQARYTAKAAA